MAKRIKDLKTFRTVSISIPMEKKNITKEVNEFAKKDEDISEEDKKGRYSLVSYITIKLWEQYIEVQKMMKKQEEEREDEPYNPSD